MQVVSNTPACDPLLQQIYWKTEAGNRVRPSNVCNCWGGGAALESGLHTLCILPLIGGESKTIKRRTTVERLLVQKHL